MSTEGKRRVLLLAVGLAVVAAVSVGDALAPGQPPAGEPAAASAVLSPVDAADSGWYCAGTAAAPAGSQASVLITNPGPRAVSGVIDSVPVGSSVAAPQSIVVPAGQQVDVPVVAGAATVLVHGGGVGVEEELAAPTGPDSAPCASGTSARWYFAEGSTAAGDGMQVALYDPLPTPAVVNVTFVSASAGTQAPPAYQGVPLAPGTVVVENVSDHVSGAPFLATEVVALSGTVAAAEVVENGGPGKGGLSIVDGASAPLSQWAFAQNADVVGGGNGFDVLNPSSSPVTVTARIALLQGQAAPLVFQVPPVTLVSLAAQDQTRIPSGSLFAITFSAARGAGIVVARVASSAGTTSPAVGVTEAQPGGVSRWLVPPVSAGESPWGLTIVNEAGRPVEVSLETPVEGRLEPVARLAGLVLPVGALRFVSSTGTPVGSAPVEVTADGPVAVELDPAPGVPGTDTVPSWPLLG